MKKKYGAKIKSKKEYVKNNLDNVRFKNYHNRKPPKKNHICTKCKKLKNYEEFGIFKSNNNGWYDIEGYRRKWHCRTCDTNIQKNIHLNNPEIRLFNLSKRRAIKNNLSFDLTKEYIKSIFPKDNKCPITGKEFKYGINNRNYTPSIDKIDPKKGYIKGNVVIISHITNALKGEIDDIEIFKKIYEFYKNIN